MHSEQPLPRVQALAPAPRRPSPGRAAGLYGEVMTMPVSRREMAVTHGGKASV